MNKYRKKKYNFIIKENISNDELDKIIKNIKNKFSPELDEYLFLRDIRELNIGNYIKYIDKTNILKGGILVRIEYLTKKYILLILMDPKNNYVWKINPIKLHIFYRNYNGTTQFSKLFKKFLKSKNMNIDNIITNKID